MTLTPFHCVRCGEPYDDATHPLHPEDNAQPPKLCRPFELARRQALLAGEYDTECPVCLAPPKSWCTDAGTSLLTMHDERAA